ncbi:hypothetical protein MVEN_02340600 [Mycena venus]|uniref:Tat pathway signal sequence n=1 Tax=Mycena venus TaxID=2733690 RepID=A0A8H7CFA3_9AGAR|nr:hypothetical protein MVEN_02340600 [Mycena venus]
MSPSAKYSPVGDSEEDLSNDQPTSRRAPPSRLWSMHAAIFSFYTLLFVGLYATTRRNSMAECVSLISTYSPAHEAVEYYNVRFNGHLSSVTTYRGPPSPAIDAAWDRISENNTLRPIRVSDEELKKIYKSDRPSNVRFSPENGGGSLGSIEVFHQLHCLNMLRKVVYKEYYADVLHLEEKRPQFFRDHINHCVDLIRQNLMCNADVGVITYNWLKGWDKPFPDFNTWHQCRNFDRILEWSHNHQVHIASDEIKRLGNEVDLTEAPM